MAGFRREAQSFEPLVLTGYYGFMDYAVPNWIRHFEDGADIIESDDSIVADLAESMEAFLQLHYTPPTKPFQISQGNSKRLRVFENFAFHTDLQQAVASSRKELTFLGEMKQSETALDLAGIVRDIRVALEGAYNDATQGGDAAKMMEEMYGQNLFKCPRLNCQRFYNGFSTADQRDHHVDKHVRPFRCTIIGCINNTVGMVSAKELEKHMKDTHGYSNDDDLDFPEDQEIARSRQVETRTVEENVHAQPAEQHTSEAAPRAQKRARISEFPCPHCQKVFKKKYNLESHLTTHNDRRPYICNECEASFARLHDLNRHKKTVHSQEKEFICGGEENGQRWGCQKKFARADTLQSHYKTAAGQACIPPGLREQQT